NSGRTISVLEETRDDRSGHSHQWQNLKFVFRDACGQRYVGGVGIDVTDSKKAEQALAERNTQLALAAKAARVGGFTNDVQADTLRISDGYAAILGFPPGTTEVLFDQWRARVHPEDVKRWDGIRDRTFRRQLSDYNFEYRVVLSDGGVRWV